MSTFKQGLKSLSKYGQLRFWLQEFLEIYWLKQNPSSIHKGKLSTMHHGIVLTTDQSSREKSNKVEVLFESVKWLIDICESLELSLL